MLHPITSIQVWAKSLGYNPVNKDHLHIIYRASEYYKLDPLLILAVIGVESSFNPNAISNKGAIGYMQIVPKWHKNKTQYFTDLSKPYSNIYLGTWILKDFINKTGSIKKALQKYNGSTNNVYSNKVLLAYNNLKEKINDRVYNQRL